MKRPKKKSSAQLQVREKRGRLERTEDSGPPHVDDIDQDTTSSSRRLKKNKTDRASKDDISGDILTLEANVMKTLRNCDVMEHLSSFLNSQDLGSWYDSCKTVRDCIDSLSLWRKHAKKLVKIMGMRKNILKEKGRKKRFNCKCQESAHFRKLCSSIQKDEVKRLRKKMNKQRRLVPAEITNAARLAHYGMLGSVRELWLKNVDLASLPDKHLAALASCVTKTLGIQNISNTDLRPILDNVRSKELYICQQGLGREETQALVRAMNCSVESLQLGSFGGGLVSYHIVSLSQYSGQGKCWRVSFREDTAYADAVELLSLAKRINWKVKYLNQRNITIERKYKDEG